MLPFDILEYQARVNETKQRMEEQGIEVLLITDPANMNYLSGYDAWSFYVHQMLVLIIDQPQPIWIGRHMDALGAKTGTWIYDENVIDYPDYYVHSPTHHPMEFIAEILTQIGQANRRIGVEMDNYYYTAKAHAQLMRHLPDAVFLDADLLVNKVRLIKSEQEIEYMKRAGLIAEQAMYKGRESIRAGARQNDTAAELYYHIVSGTEEYGGEYPAIVPFLPTGENTAIPHLTWSDRRFKEGETVSIEIAGCYKRYHVPLARTAAIGKPPEKILGLTAYVTEGLNEVLQKIKPGMTCEDVNNIWKASIHRHGIVKEARLGYSVGLNYPPDWGEHTASLRSGDQTILQPNMTFHLIPALWFDNYGIEISETIKISDTGCETFTNFPRDLIIQDRFTTNPQDGKIS
ncbi:M24 family metallopeptidase [Sediminibacillus albus]|uniref:Xaa-Pro dipeptidase n=1 Tax=Sediminibacillus albus TaxID=407036 RepID=A0A1G9A1I6_9BACI|nr:M24 family metallopeptidase [Sediminibacillus albus]SDK20250.1 Xaa-Pro dipeptidase [Sediminibacillus albus]